MPLKLYLHPLASFCHKALIALYENGIAFEPIIVDLRDEVSSAAFRAVWPMAKMPVLRDEARKCTVAESTIIVEFLDAHYPGSTRFLPADVDRAWQTRMWDRFYDHYVQEPMQKIVGDRLRPEGKNDFYGVQLAKDQLHTAYRVLETTSLWPIARLRPLSSMPTPLLLLPRRTKIYWPISTA
jgi:glutathione S-transferase